MNQFDFVTKKQSSHLKGWSKANLMVSLNTIQKKQMKNRLANEILFGSVEKRPVIRTNTSTPMIENAARSKKPKEEQLHPTD
jgi:hypothetical protein